MLIGQKHDLMRTDWSGRIGANAHAWHVGVFGIRLEEEFRLCLSDPILKVLWVCSVRLDSHFLIKDFVLGF